MQSRTAQLPCGSTFSPLGKALQRTDVSKGEHLCKFLQSELQWLRAGGGRREKSAHSTHNTLDLLLSDSQKYKQLILQSYTLPSYVGGSPTELSRTYLQVNRPRIRLHHNFDPPSTAFGFPPPMACFSDVCSVSV